MEQTPGDHDLDTQASGDIETPALHDTHQEIAQDEHGHGAHDDEHGHGEDTSEQSTLVPTTWKQLIFPALILLLVAILVVGPIANAFAPKPLAPTGPAPVTNGSGNGQPTAGAATTVTAATAQPTATTANTGPTATTASQMPAAPQVAVQNTQAPPQATATTVAAVTVNPVAITTQTAVAVLGQQGVVARAPVQLNFGGAQFAVQPGTGLLPDWKPIGDEGRATWIEGTFANHIIYLPYSDGNAALFQAVKAGDAIKLTMSTGQVFDFAVTHSGRAFNGPPTADGQFTVETAMTQDHAGVTLFLVGDPASDRAVVQADFTGNIE